MVDALLRTQPYKGFPVVTDTRKVILVGYISRSELRFALGTRFSDDVNSRSSEESTRIIRIEYVLFHTSTIPRNNRLRRSPSMDGFHSNNTESRFKHASGRSTFREIGSHKH